MQINSIIYQNSSIFYRVTGAGQTIVLLHGFGEDGTVWLPQIDFLTPHFRVIVPDIPGSGQSEFIPGTSIESYAEVTKLILDSESKKFPRQEAEVAIIGHSMGGYITLAFAEKYPQYLNSFGLFHSSAFADKEEKKEVRRKAIEFINTKGAHTFLKLTTPTLFAKAFTEKYPEKVSALMENGKNFTNATLIQYYEAMINRPDRTAVLQNFNKPVLFIIGEHDQAIPLQSSLQQCYLPLQSHVHILSQSAHMGMWEEKEKANEILFNFLFNKF